MAVLLQHILLRTIPRDGEMWSAWLMLGGVMMGILMGFPIVDIVGEVSFDLQIPVDTQQFRNENVTAAAPVECLYQYPEAKQVDAMLSNMMNQLTKVFVSVHKYLSLVKGSRWGGEGWRWGGEGWRRARQRYAVVGAKQTDFFDHIYANMTEEYRRFVNETQARVPPAFGDPCDHQREIRDVWRTLLDTSQRSLRRAAQRCVEEYLRLAQCRSKRVRERASAMLQRELGRVRADQLSLLCDNFQLCYNDLL